jgi:transposase InsO family protein
MCRLYGVSRAGFYAWRRRPPSRRQTQDAPLARRIVTIYAKSKERYGSPRIHRALRKEGIRVGRKRVARLMRQLALKGRSARIYLKKAKQRKYFSGIPNQSRGVVLSRPNQVWLGDITYLKVAGRWRYLAVVMDKYSRRIVGWKFGRNKGLDLTMGAFNQAVEQRKPEPGLIFHTDRGTEYAAFAFRDRLTELGCIQSMNRPTAKLTDNAHMESFFKTKKAQGVQGNNLKD